jgi:hypothetical protein
MKSSTSRVTWLRGSILLFCLVCSSPASAGPPFLTDDPEPVDLRHWEIYAASQFVDDREGRSGAAPFFDINYGAVHNIHLHVLVQAAFAMPSEGPRHYGFGDSEIGAKIRFVEETPSRPQAAIYPAIEFPTGDATAGLGAGKVQAFLPLWVQKTWERWTTYGGGGYWINPGEGNKDWVYLGLTLQHSLGKRLMAGGEVFHRTADTAGGSSSTGFNLGGGFDVTSEYHLLLSAGRDLEGPNRFTGYVSVQWTYPGD